MATYTTIKRIGLFDSGIGGITVLKELLALPCQEFIYVADTAHVPYGQKTPEQIAAYSLEIASFLAQQQVDALVIACHTSSAIALEQVQAAFPHIPVIGTIVQTMAHAAQQTKNKRIGVMATQASINSHLHKQQLLAIDPTLHVAEQACPALVPLIEAAQSHPAAEQAALLEYLTPLKQQGIDTLILGCTHYPLRAQEISAIIGADVTLVSSERVIAQELLPYMPRVKPDTQTVTMYATSNPEETARKASIILGFAQEASLLDFSEKHNPVEIPKNLRDTTVS